MPTPISVELLPPTSFRKGQNPSATGSIPDGFVAAKVRVDRSQWSGPVTPADVIQAHFDVSLDGGVTWQPVAKFTTPGGALYQGQRAIAYTPAPGEVPIQESSATVQLPPGTGRQYRVSADIFADLTTSVWVDWS